MEGRDFLKASALAVAAAGPFLGKAKGANDRVRVGQIGLGGRSKYEFGVCMQNPGCQIAALADVYQPFVDLAVRRLDGKPDGYKTITACHLAVIAYRTKRTIHCDAQKERIVGDEEAQKLTSKDYPSA